MEERIDLMADIHRILPKRVTIPRDLCAEMGRLDDCGAYYVYQGSLVSRVTGPGNGNAMCETSYFGEARSWDGGEMDGW